jgi:hypothetical protein
VPACPGQAVVLGGPARHGTRPPVTDSLQGRHTRPGPGLRASHRGQVVLPPVDVRSPSTGMRVATCRLASRCLSAQSQAGHTAVCIQYSVIISSITGFESPAIYKRSCETVGDVCHSHMGGAVQRTIGLSAYPFVMRPHSQASYPAKNLTRIPLNGTALNTGDRSPAL